MASFATSLWDSIFTPGPTPALVKAMNISFFALFALLIPLTFFTHNIHVLLLTLLSVGLWVAVQWFLMELEKAKQAAQQPPQPDSEQKKEK